ncbi:MAG: bifunctional precorrin-2 dehydrogenase/sirohydrochlorin ferrochelatase, partial [Balneolaceae bacterium]
MNVYPIYLTRLHEKITVLIGGNHEAERKADELLQREAKLTVISPGLSDKLMCWADDGKIEWVPRRYREGDLEGAFLVIAAEFEEDENRRIYREAEERGILVNVMDDIPNANFSFGSIVKRGNLTLSISTSGAAPTLAVRLRERFEKEFGEEYETFLTLMQKLRGPMRRQLSDFDQRKSMWYQIVDSDVIDLFR